MCGPVVNVSSCGGLPYQGTAQNNYTKCENNASHLQIIHFHILSAPLALSISSTLRMWFGSVAACQSGGCGWTAVCGCLCPQLIL